MRERAEKIGAHLRVFSGASAGTEVELSVPGHVAFQGHSRRRRSWFRKRNSPATRTKEPSAEKGTSE